MTKIRILLYAITFCCCCTFCAPIEFDIPKDAEAFFYDQIITNPNGRKSCMYPDSACKDIRIRKTTRINPLDHNLDGVEAWCVLFSGQQLNVYNGDYYQFSEIALIIKADREYQLEMTVDGNFNGEQVCTPTGIW